MLKIFFPYGSVPAINSYATKIVPNQKLALFLNKSCCLKIATNSKLWEDGMEIETRR